MQIQMDGKICIVTGANSGIGYATAESLASRYLFSPSERNDLFTPFQFIVGMFKSVTSTQAFDIILSQWCNCVYGLSK